MLKDIKMRFVIQMGITYFTSGSLKSSQILMQESLGQNLCNSHPPLQNNCPVWTFNIKKKKKKKKHRNSASPHLITDFQDSANMIRTFMS